ncbi:hypothetical protein FOH10_19155 [Nocardia otitidiscaviarum]|uniref:DUF6879 domain-containing protein n=1 Tax=Nocardia otitidiscaviarum TaxID=1823 RepID=A0A516NNN1_9NOCA|nr:DUF6879 family protein [Nocardia otitidiscaviarum]MCP9624246.1 hypothetical protein [Nocardia otitidiscaviarum]QDP80516.1 hypothetical protein FOH10_19155 [Nocardia otitidiscaviarum]
MELRVHEPWPDLFRAAQRSAFHLEVRDTYAVPSESEPLRRFLAGEPRSDAPDDAWSEWSSLVEEVTGRGVTVSRVRVISVPHSDYQRWLLTETADNIEAGEDIRYLPRHLVDPELVPGDDFWIFDDAKVAFNLVDEYGRPAGAGITTDPGIVGYSRDARIRLWALAVPFHDYIVAADTR